MAPAPAPEFFADSPRAELSQGDIALAPTAVIWSPDRYHPDFSKIPSPPPLGQTVFVPAWDDYSKEGMPIPVVEARWSPVMIVSHDCEIDKEFNRELARLLGRGYAEDEAVRIASDNPELDKLIVVSPIVGYHEVPDDQWEGIASGSRIGFFPIPPAPVFNGEPLLVDLTRLASVDRLLLTRYEKLASLTNEAAGVLRFKISESYSSRGLALLAELEAMVGHTINQVEVQGKSKKATVVMLHLSNGEQTAIEIRRPREDAFAAFTRILKRQQDRPADAR